MMEETTVFEERIPHIDAAYRALATQDGRTVPGGSMGGRGSLEIAFKYPQDRR